MAQNITITIPHPILTGTQHFKVRFKSHGLPNWTPLPNQTNAPFQISNLADGDYDIEYTLVMDDGTECPERVDHFNLHSTAPGCACITNVTGVVELISANNYQIRINFTPAANPQCGWLVTYAGSQSIGQAVSYPTLTSPLIIPIPSNDAYTVTITADCCGRDHPLCATLDLPRASGTNCVQAVFPANEGQNLIIQNAGQYFMQLTCSQQSNPITTSFTVNYQQTQTSPFAPDIGSVVVTPTGTAPNIILLFPIHPEPSNPLDYLIQVSDVCGRFYKVTKI